MTSVKNIHITFLSAFSGLGLVCYALLQNQWIENDISLLIFCFILILTLGVSHGALDHLRGAKILKPILKKGGFWYFILAILAFHYLSLFAGYYFHQSHY
jgi:hypothetical protein